jgi:hypothetical protein
MLSRNETKEVKRMDEKNNGEKVEWEKQSFYADGEIEFVELRFIIPAGQWAKFKKSILYKKLTGEFSHLEKIGKSTKLSMK